MTDPEIERLLGHDGDLPENPGIKKRKRRRRWLIIVVILLVLAAGAVFVLGISGGDSQRVAVLNPAYKDIESTLTVSGPVSGTDSVDIVSNIHAEIKQIAVAEGDRVRKGS